MQLSADEVKAKRQELGLTQKEFAAALGMGPNGERTVRRWEAGETRPTAAESKYISTLGHRAPFAPAGEGKPAFTFTDKASTFVSGAANTTFAGEENAINAAKDNVRIFFI